MLKITFFFLIGLVVLIINVYGDFEIIKRYIKAVKEMDCNAIFQGKWMEKYGVLLGEEALIIGHVFVWLWFALIVLLFMFSASDLFGRSVLILDVFYVFFVFLGSLLFGCLRVRGFLDKNSYNPTVLKDSHTQMLLRSLFTSSFVIVIVLFSLLWLLLGLPSHLIQFS